MLLLKNAKAKLCDFQWAVFSCIIESTCELVMYRCQFFGFWIHQSGRGHWNLMPILMMAIHLESNNLAHHVLLVLDHC